MTDLSATADSRPVIASWFRDHPNLSAFVLCLALYMPGITWGLPARFHPDEKAGTVVHMIEGRTIVPDSFINPSLPLFAMVPGVLLQTIGSATRLLDGIAADTLFACRVQSALAAVLAVVLFGHALRRVRPTTAGPLLMLAVMPGNVNFARFATPESWLLLGTVATLTLCLAYVDGRGRAKWLGLALGLTISCKYTASALAAPVALSILLRESDPEEPPSKAWLFALPLLALAGFLLRSGVGLELASHLGMRGDARLLRPESALSFVREAGAWAVALSGLGLLAWGSTRRSRLIPLLCQTALFTGAGFVAGTPGCLVSPYRFLSDVAFNAQTRFGYKGFSSSDSSWGAYASLLTDTAGWPFCIAAMVGIVALLRNLRRVDKISWVLLASGVATFVLLATSGHRAMRFLVPALPCVAWFSAQGVAAVPSISWRKRVGGLLIGATLAQALLLVRLFYVDSRIEAGSWLQSRMGAGETWGLISNFPGYGPRLDGAAPLDSLRRLSRELAPASVFVAAAGDLSSEGPDWLVVPDLYFQRYLERPDSAPERARFFSDLLHGRIGYALAARFQQGELWRPPNEFVDPQVLVFRRSRPKEPPVF